MKERIERMIPVEKTHAKKGLKKPEIIAEVAERAGVTQALAKDILDAFTDIAVREMVVTGVFNWPNLPTVTRQVRTGVKRYQSDIDKTLLYPDTCFLTARIPEPVRKMHRDVFRRQNNELNGTTMDNWWEPYVYCDGDWRKK